MMSLGVGVETWNVRRTALQQAPQVSGLAERWPIRGRNTGELRAKKNPLPTLCMPHTKLFFPSTLSFLPHFLLAKPHSPAVSSLILAIRLTPLGILRGLERVHRRRIVSYYLQFSTNPTRLTPIGDVP